MKKIIKIATVLLVAVTFISCGTSSYMVVRERPTSPYYDRPVRGGSYWRVPPPRRHYSPGYRQPHNGGYYRRNGKWHR